MWGFVVSGQGLPAVLRRDMVLWVVIWLFLGFWVDILLCGGATNGTSVLRKLTTNGLADLFSIFFFLIFLLLLGSKFCCCWSSFFFGNGIVVVVVVTHHLLLIFLVVLETEKHNPPNFGLKSEANRGWYLFLSNLLAGGIRDF